MDCLLLNADFRPLCLYPLSLISWKDAIRLVYQEKVSVVEFHEDWTVHSQYSEMKVPAVVASKFYVSKQRRNVAFSRRAVLQRDNFTCQYCMKPCMPDELTLDHVYPASKGGRTTWDNIVAACYKCNGDKGDKLIKPKITPEAPGYDDLLRMLSAAPEGKQSQLFKHPTWKRYGELT